MNIEKLIFEYFTKNEPRLREMIIEHNRDRLYWQGVDSEGSSLGEYKPYTIYYKTHIAPQLGYDTRTENITLKDTGAYYRSFTVEFGADEMEILSTDSKANELEERYGKVFGMTERDISSFNDRIRPDFKDFFVENLKKYVYENV